MIIFIIERIIYLRIEYLKMVYFGFKLIFVLKSFLRMSWFGIYLFYLGDILKRFGLSRFFKNFIF